jgi:cyclopropane fatty-acyl-phospholipid synthase-like methyltransferase
MGEVEALYQAGWQDPLENQNLTGGTTPALAQNYTRELTHTLGLVDLDGKKILDFGGGRGEMALAWYARPRGCQRR